MRDVSHSSGPELRHRPIASVMTRDVYQVPPDTSLLQLTTEMRQRRISCVVVCDRLRPVGIISERDVVRILCETSLPAKALKASDVMSSPVQTISPAMLCPQVMQSMRQQSFRRFPVVDEKGELVGLVTQTDLVRASEQDLAEYSARLERAIEQKTDELNRVSVLKDDLMGMIVHDLKNPLAVVLGILDAAVLGRKAIEDPKLRKRLALALEAAQAMLRMVLNLLDITKIEAGEVKPDRAFVACQDLVQRAAAPLVELANRDGIQVEILHGDPARKLYVDSGLLERVLQNLLSNAIKFSPPNGRIEVLTDVETGSGPPRFTLRVSNWGKAIPSEYHLKIFDKFSQLEAKSSGNIASTGLGLTFCKLAVEAHGGRIQVESPIDGERGARFTCLLPLE